jgi:2-keto-4-pentenoate hydratase
MQHPINVVLWLRDALKTEGLRLEKGDLISLGSITALVPAQLGTYTLKYDGLVPDEVKEVKVTFSKP